MITQAENFFVDISDTEKQEKAEMLPWGLMPHLGDEMSQWEQRAVKMLSENLDGHSRIFPQCQKLLNNSK